MNEAFVIMRIGDSRLDNMWSKIYYPILKECGLEPKRIDKHNEGRLLTSEIADFIKRARIIIADLTDERPNCYLEIGYAMGIGKFKNLILCAEKQGKIHFDLSGYDILRWETDNIDLFKIDLIKKIKYRLNNLEGQEQNNINIINKINTWVENEHKAAISNFNKVQRDNGYVEAIFIPESEHIRTIKGKLNLINIAKKAECKNTGWPVGVVLDKKAFSPKKEQNGIRAVIDESNDNIGLHYDYWMLRNDGLFYFLRNFDAEAEKDKRVLCFDIRIYRIAEILIYCTRLYKEFGLKDSDKIEIKINHGGLQNRILTAYDFRRHLFGEYENIHKETIEFTIRETLQGISNNIELYVFEVARDLFEYFDWDDFSRDVSNDIVNKFTNRKF